MGASRSSSSRTRTAPRCWSRCRCRKARSIEATSAAATKVEDWLKQQPEAKIVTTYVGQGAPRFFFAYNPELPDPSFAKIIVLTPDAEARDALKRRLRAQIAEGLAPEARVRVDAARLRPVLPASRSRSASWDPIPPSLREHRRPRSQAVMRANPNTRQVNQDWGERVAHASHFVLDQDRLRLIGLTPSDAGEQLQFLLTGVPVTQVREDIRTVDVVARSSGPERLDPARLGDLTLTSHDGQPRSRSSQIGTIEVRTEDPILRRRDRTPTITVQSDIDEEPAAAPRLHGRSSRPCSRSIGQAALRATASRWAATSRNRARPTRRSPRCSRS